MRTRLALLLALPLLLCGFASVHLAGSGLNSESIPVCTFVGDDAWNFDNILFTETNPNFTYQNQGTNALPFGSDASCDTFKTAGVPACPTVEPTRGMNATGSISFTGSAFEKGLIISDDSRADFTTSNKFSVTFHAQATSGVGNADWVFTQYGNVLTKSGVYLPDEYRIGDTLERTTICIEVIGATGGGTCGNHLGESTADWALGDGWHHFAFIWNGDPTPPYTAAVGEYIVYQDEIEVGRQTGITGRITNSTGLSRIGDTLNNFSQMFIRLDNMNVFYNTALTQPQVADTNCVVPTTH